MTKAVDKGKEQAKASQRFMRENLMDTKFSEEAADEVKHGDQSQGMLASYGAKTGKPKIKTTKVDRDY